VAPPEVEPAAAAVPVAKAEVDPGPPTQPAAAAVPVAKAEVDPGPPTQPAAPPVPVAKAVAPAEPEVQSPARPAAPPVRADRREPKLAPTVAAAPPAGGRSRSRPVVAAVAVLAAIAVVALLLAHRESGDPTAAGDSSATTVVPTGDSQGPAVGGGSAATTAKPAPKATTAPKANAGSRPDGVPRDWESYQDPATGYTIFHPPGWNVVTNGSLTDFRDPRSAAYLRVDYTTSPGPSAVQAWLDFEPRFAAENPNYERVRIDPTTFHGYQAAIWEYTYTGLGTDLRAADLGFVTGSHGFALNFQTRADDWNGMQDVFEAFQASFRAPGG
jgi:hypothetical protein